MKIIEGNLLDQSPGILCHQVNCMGVMGAGIALQIKRKWPWVYEGYSIRCKSPIELGTSTFHMVSKYVCVANLFGQQSIGQESNQTSYEHYPQMMGAVKEFSGFMELPIYIPYGIGCGLAGGDWNVMLPILEKHVPEATLVRYTP